MTTIQPTGDVKKEHCQEETAGTDQGFFQGCHLSFRYDTQSNETTRNEFPRFWTGLGLIEARPTLPQPSHWKRAGRLPEEESSNRLTGHALSYVVSLGFLELRKEGNKKTVSGRHL